MRLACQRGLNHPMEWVEFFESHTNYEWALQIAKDRIQPIGERRDDLRAAWLATAIIAANSTEQLSVEKLKQKAEAIANYLFIMNPFEDE